ncbi:MAG: beta-galactosidase trimerization domain-containing protein, partial [bacterium]|nr:beta-galactosidase trimerization domain-containing protein [bacterium]
ISRIGFYDSRTNRNLYGEAEARSLRQMKVWMQACYRNNVPFDLFQQEELERLGEYAVVVLNEVAMLSDEEMVALRSFVVNGGTLVWTGRTGERDEKGIRREGDYLAELWDLADAVPVLDGGDVVEHSVGEGVLVRIAGDWGTEPYEGAYNADRWQAEEIRVPFRAMTDAGLVDRREIVAFLVALLPDGPDLEVEGLSEGVVVTAYVSGAGDGLCVHLVNAAETLDVRSGGAVGHADPIPLPMHSGAPIHIRVRKPAALAGRAVANAQYLDPEKEGEVNLPVVDEGLVVSVEVDPGLIGCYGLIAMDFSG